MKKLLPICALFALLVTGCSCSKATEKTYENAYSVYKNTDAIKFTRIEEIRETGKTTYLQKRVDASFLFDTNGEVVKMHYTLKYTDVSNSGSSSLKQTNEYYFDRNLQEFYSYSKVGATQEIKNKEHIAHYSDKIDINKCDNRDCYLMILANLTPIKRLDEVTGFTIEDENGEGIVSYTAVCPSFEECNNSSQTLDYSLTIDKKGNISRLSYVIPNEDLETTVKYTFHGYGSNNVSIDFPNTLRNV